MATDKKKLDNSGIARPVRIIDSTGEDMTEMKAGHLVPGADPPKNEHARGGFGDRDGKTGFGSDSGNGPSAITVNEDTEDSSGIIPDGLPTAERENQVDDPIVQLPSAQHMQQSVSDISDEILRKDEEPNR